MLVLGLDLSTQGLKATTIDDSLEIVSEVIVNFERDLPHYETRGGALFGDDGAAFSPTRMFVEALDVVLARLASANVRLQDVGAISASGQQHGSVYWKRGSQERLSKLDASRSLLDQLADSFSYPNSPIWMDASTRKYCEMIEKAAGGAQQLADLTGSKAFRRFTASQVAKIYDTSREAYGATERVSLISAFVVSVLLQRYAPEDVSDAAGMNLMEIRSEPPQWSRLMVESVAGGLRSKLCDAPEHSFTVLGSIGPYFQQRFGMAHECRIVTAAGDNPCSAAGMLLREDEDLCVSLGTSDTAFMLSQSATPCSDVGSVYRNPLSALSYMPLVVYSNGALTREAVRDYGGNTRSWEAFEDAVNRRPKANDGIVGFHFPRPEIVPETNSALYVHFREKTEVPEAEVDWPTRARATLEMRALAIRYHVERLGLTRPKRIVATGGGANSPVTIEILADVLNCPVYTSTAANSAGLGAAYRAYHALQCRDGFVPFAEAISRKLDIDAKLTLRAEPDASVRDAYDGLYEHYIACEEIVLRMQHQPAAEG